MATVKFDSLTSMVAIVGGTGACEGAAWSFISVTWRRNSPYSHDTIHLLFH